MFPLFIVNGVTGVRDLGSNLEATLAARDSAAAHQLIGPRMLVSGPMIDGPTTRYAAAIKVATVPLVEVEPVQPKILDFGVRRESPGAWLRRPARNTHLWE
ncbi:MAG: hypothetical protein ACRENP_28565 [Longimicrobiales bacterium]